MKGTFLSAMRGLLIMMVFFTRIPFNKMIDFDEDDYKMGVMLFPVLGLLIGVLLAGVAWIFSRTSSSVSALVVTGFYIWLTGGIHLDGLADTMDGLYSGKEKDQIFQIMKDSRIGAFGVIGLIFIILAYFILIQETSLGALFLMAIAGKTSIIAAASVSDYPKEKGIGDQFVKICGENHRNFAFLFGIITAIVINIKMIVPMVGTWIIVGYIIQNIKKKIGGMTGDTLGFVHEIGQIVFLLIVSLL